MTKENKENPIRDKEQDEMFFRETAGGFLALLKVPIPKNKEEAKTFLTTYDEGVDELKNYTQESGKGYSSHTIVLFGSVLGEALRILWNGVWKFSDKKNRWVMMCSCEKGIQKEVDVFDLVEKSVLGEMKTTIYAYCMSLEKYLQRENKF